MTTPAVPYAQVISCPVLDCGWTLDASGPDPRSVQQETLASVFGMGVFASVAIAGHNERIEREIATHLETHDLVQYVRTMTHQREQLARTTAHLEAASETVGRLQLALAELSSALGVDVATDGELDDWMSAMRTEIRRLNSLRTAASGGTWDR
jgi:hypothetical protein